MMSTLFTFAEPDHTTAFTGAECRPINYATAARIITEHHYLHREPSIMWPLGYYLDGVLAGVITLSRMPGPNARAVCGDDHQGQAYELSRLFMFDWAGQNAESSFIGAAFKWYTQRATPEGGWVLVSYADTGAGHVGTIYKATNWTYTGHVMKPKGIGEDGEPIHERTSHDPRKGLHGQHVVARIATPIKHRYVTFLGTKRQKRELRAALRWPVLDYPK